jgi:predicted Zn-dependent protease
MDGRRVYSFLLILVLLLIQACSFWSKENPDAEPTSLTQSEQLILDDYKAEVEVGRNMAGRLLTFYGEYQDKSLKNYVNTVGSYVAKSGDYPDRRYMFGILDSDSVNAFACPGGYILVTRGVIEAAANEAELAAILGHETAHVGKKHMFNALRSMSKDQVERAQAEASARKRPDKFSRARLRPEPDVNDSGSALAKLMTTASGAGMGILQAAKAGMSLLLEKGLDKDLEFEADREGVRYAIRAGYEPRALDRFLERLSANKKKNNDKTVMDVTHPSIPDRRKVIADALNRLGADQIVGAIGKERFDTARADLVNKRKDSK